ncbi:MAG: hypothetical protein FWE45_01990 [Firmicutes bacterium]|nr:hypothetical protein [Bacillota bacterium]
MKSPHRVLFFITGNEPSEGPDNRLLADLFLALNSGHFDHSQGGFRPFFIMPSNIASL